MGELATGLLWSLPLTTRYKSSGGHARAQPVLARRPSPFLLRAPGRPAPTVPRALTQDHALAQGVSLSVLEQGSRWVPALRVTPAVVSPGTEAPVAREEEPVPEPWTEALLWPVPVPPDALGAAHCSNARSP